MLSLSKIYYQFLLSYGFATGIGFGALYIPSVSVLSQYYRKRRALAIGFSATGASIGGILFPIQLHQMFQSVGYGWSIRTSTLLSYLNSNSPYAQVVKNIAGFIILLTSGTGTLLLRARLPPKRTGPILDFSVYKALPYSLYVAGILVINIGLYLVSSLLSSNTEIVS